MTIETRENRTIFGCLAALIAICVLAAFMGDGAHATSDRVDVYECGKAVGVHDSVPGYRITRKARFVQFEDGSGRLVCGEDTMVIVHVPW